MPFVPTCLTCLSASSAYVPTCLLALNYYVPTGFTLKLLHTYFPSFFAYLCANLLTCLYIFFVPLCLRVLNYFLPTCAHLSRAYVPTTTHKIYWGSLFIHRTLASKTAYLNPNLWGFVISSGAWAETTIWGPIKKLFKTMDCF